jgi:glycosyltransferase involved in cell wall biosynthesis
MNIDTVNNHYQLGGAETVARQLHEGALAAGHNARFHVAEGSRWPKVRGLKPLYPRWLARLSESRFRAWAHRIAPRRRWTDRAFRALEKSDSTVVHVHSFHGLYASLESLAIVARAKPVVWTFHRFWAITGGCDHPFGCERYQSGCGDCPQVGCFAVGPVDHTAQEWENKHRVLANLPFTVVSPSRHLADRVRASALGRNWNVKVIPNGVSPTTFAGTRKGNTDLKRSLGLASGKVSVLFTNRDFKDPIKGFPIVKTALETRKWAEIQVVLIGGNSAWAKSQLPMDIDVWDAGYLSDRVRLAAFYEASDIFLYASDGENLPCAVLEAMGAECCVVATPVDGVLELIEDDRSGLLAANVSGEALAASLAESLRLDPGQRRALGRAARSKVETEFSEQNMVESYLNLYEQMAVIRP